MVGRSRSAAEIVGGGISKNIFRASCVQFLPSRASREPTMSRERWRRCRRSRARRAGPSSLWPSPQRDQTDAVLAAIAGFVKRIGGKKSGAGGGLSLTGHDRGKAAA